MSYDYNYNYGSYAQPHYQQRPGSSSYLGGFDGYYNSMGYNNLFGNIQGLLDSSNYARSSINSYSTGNSGSYLNSLAQQGMNEALYWSEVRDYYKAQGYSSYEVNQIVADLKGGSGGSVPANTTYSDDPFWNSVLTTANSSLNASNGTGSETDLLTQLMYAMMLGDLTGSSDDESGDESNDESSSKTDIFSQLFSGLFGTGSSSSNSSSSNILTQLFSGMFGTGSSSSNSSSSNIFTQLFSGMFGTGSSSSNSSSSNIFTQLMLGMFGL